MRRAGCSAATRKTIHKRADAHALEHAQRTGLEAEHTFGIENGVRHHAEAQQRGREIDLLASVKHGGCQALTRHNGKRRRGGGVRTLSEDNLIFARS